jgi:hypothetical protein
MVGLEAGRFYASTGIEIATWTVTSQRIAISIRPRGDARYTTEFIGDGGRVLEVRYGTPVEYELDDDVTYVRALVRDSRGDRAWIQPVFTRIAEQSGG